MPQNLQQRKLIYICVNQIKMSLPQKHNYNQNITHKKINLNALLNLICAEFTSKIFNWDNIIPFLFVMMQTVLKDAKCNHL